MQKPVGNFVISNRQKILNKNVNFDNDMSLIKCQLYVLLTNYIRQSLFCTLQTIKSIWQLVTYLSNINYHQFSVLHLKVYHTACIWIWMSKRPGATSDNGFIFLKINENLNIKEKKKSCEPFWRAALTRHGQSCQSADFRKIAKMALFNPCLKFDFFGGPNDFIWSD